eukprot:scaffold44700_cov81-Cyclotella_meneghiniana.AAC.1
MKKWERAGIRGGAGGYGPLNAWSVQAQQRCNNGTTRHNRHNKAQQGTTRHNKAQQWHNNGTTMAQQWHNK